MKKVFTLALALVLLASLAILPMGASAEETVKITIAYQYGIAYLPLVVMKDQQLIEKYAPHVEVNWQVLNSGPAINEGMIAGSIDVGAMGIAPAIIGVIKGIPYKIFSALSSQPQAIMTNNPNLKTLRDITPETRIAVVNISGIQHIFLAMLAKNELGDAHAMDNNVVAMSHPDGMAALLAGSVDCQVATAPYLFKERDAGMYTCSSIDTVWPVGNTFIVGVASANLKEKHPEVYDALIRAMADATDYLTYQKEAAAEALCGRLDVDAATLLRWISDPACGYACQTRGLMKMATFMAENGFVDRAPADYAELVYENVTGD